MMRVLPASLVACWLAYCIFMKSALKRRQTLRLLVQPWEIYFMYWKKSRENCSYILDRKLVCRAFCFIILSWGRLEESLGDDIIDTDFLGALPWPCMQSCLACARRGTNWICSFGGYPFHPPFGSLKALTVLNAHSMETPRTHQYNIRTCQTQLSWRWWLLPIATCGYKR